VLPASLPARHPVTLGAHWPGPPLAGQAAFTEETEDGHLRHPRFQGLRLDKDPAEVVREMPWGGV